MQHFVELLPGDVIQNVAKWIARCSDPYPKAITFAKGSEARRQAMLKALDFRLVFHEKHRAIFPDLITLFAEFTREISFMGVNDDHFLDYIPRLPHLEKAAIVCRKRQIIFISNNTTVTSLEVDIPEALSLLWLPPCFASLRYLTNLILHVPGCGQPGHDLQRVMAQACPNVTTLDLGGKNVCHAYLEVVKNLPSLESLSYSNSVRLYSRLEYFRSLKEVHLCSENLMKYAEYIGPPVRTLIMIHTMNFTELLKLERCPNLKTLLVAVEDGAEIALLGKTRNMESLDIRWGYPKGGWSSRLNELVDEDIYYKPDEDFLISLARNSPKLKRLFLERALIPTPLLEKIIQHIGDRLEQFGVQMTGQDENVAPRLEAILKCLSRHCPNMKCLVLMGMKMETRVLKGHTARCRLALSQARRRCPNLNIEDINSHINRMTHIRRKRKWPGRKVIQLE